jgi:hypothetical protein
MATRKRGAGPKNIKTMTHGTYWSETNKKSKYRRAGGGTEEGQRLDQNISTATNLGDGSLQNT